MSIQPVMKDTSLNDGRKICCFSVENGSVGKADVDVKEYKERPNVFRTEIYNSNKHLLGYDFFDMPQNKPMFNYDITVFPAFRGKGLGELLRLTSIAHMVENNAEQMNLYSKASAIYFHAKYGFEPNIKEFEQRHSSLVGIMSNTLPECDIYVKEADKIMKASKDPFSLSFKENQKYTSQTNELLKDFIKKVLAIGGQDKSEFACGFSMKLMRDTIFERAEFFNSLFKKHGIKFKI